jgi:hypothetical protein
MTECTRLSDRMLAVAHGRAAWESEEEHHLASCRDCRIEWDMMRATARLGAGLTEDFPSDRVATRVVASLRQPAPRVLRFPDWRWLAVPAAAAAVAMLVMRSPVPAPTRVAPVAVTAQSSSLLPEADALEAAELESVLQLLPVASGEVEDIHMYNDMTEDELDAVLQSLEG